MKKEENKEMSLKEKVDFLMDTSGNSNVKRKKFRVPRKGKVTRSKLRKGYCTILRVDDNGNVDFEKQKIEDSTVQLSTKDYHAVQNKDVLTYKGTPFIIQPTSKKNPCNPLSDGKNETYGQKLIMARMLRDAIKQKTGGGKIIIWLIVLGIAGYVAYSIFTGGA